MDHVELVKVCHKFLGCDSGLFEVEKFGGVAGDEGESGGGGGGGGGGFLDPDLEVEAVAG